MLISCVHALAAVALAVWAGLQSGWGGTLSAWLAGLAWVCVVTGLGAWLARRAFPADGERLSWDGAAWALSTLSTRSSHSAAQTRSRRAVHAVPITQLVLALDLGNWLLLRLQTGTGTFRWQAVRAACVGPAWHALRVALLTQAGPQPTSVAPARHNR